MEVTGIREHFRFLGRRVKDVVTSYEGVGISGVFDLPGCVQTVVKPKAKDGKLEDGQCFDNNRLVLVDGGDLVMPLPDFLAPLFAKDAKPAKPIREKGPVERPASLLRR